MAMTSSRPYLIRSLYEWIVDNNCTPYILVDAYSDGVEVPQEHVNKDGQIVLNVTPTAVKDLLIQNDYVSFNARFGGVPTDISVPTGAVLGVYARENGQGMIFEPEPEPETDPEPPKPTKDEDSTPAPAADVKRPSLRVVK